jgi:hypothetical protein
VSVDLRCPNCGASASLPLGMTCADHRPVIWCYTCNNTHTVTRDGALGALVESACPDCPHWVTDPTSSNDGPDAQEGSAVPADGSEQGRSSC